MMINWIWNIVWMKARTMIEYEKMVSDFIKFITGVHDDRYIFVTGGAGRG